MFSTASFFFQEGCANEEVEGWRVCNIWAGAISVSNFFPDVSEMTQNVKFWNAGISSFHSTKLQVANADLFVLQ